MATKRKNTTKGIAGKVVSWKCPACDWHRDWHDSSYFLDKFIDHPLYGRIKESVLVEKDIAEHECAVYRERASHLRRMYVQGVQERLAEITAA